MDSTLKRLLKGYEVFKQNYTSGAQSMMNQLAQGQKPEIMFVACCDSRVDPALLLQCDPGDVFVVRNVANIVPPYEKDGKHHGTSAALEFGICYLKVKHLIILGHSNCGGIQALSHKETLKQDDFITSWVSLIETSDQEVCAKQAMNQSYEHALQFPWIQEQIKAKQLQIHRWYFTIETGTLSVFNEITQKYELL